MKHYIDEKQLRYMEFVHRESAVPLQSMAEEKYHTSMMAEGNLEVVKESSQVFASERAGHLSDDPLRNCKYLFVAATTVCCRTALDAGMDERRAYDVSDLYIQKMDTLKTEEEVRALHVDMVSFYTEEIAALDKRNVYSRPIVECLDYIYNHLHEVIRLSDLAELVGLSKSYLSTLFKQEMGKTIKEYILSKRIEAACNMLKFSDYTSAEIGAILTFSSQGHFSRVFKEQTGQTPREYRNTFLEPKQESAKNISEDFETHETDLK